MCMCSERFGCLSVGGKWNWQEDHTHTHVEDENSTFHTHLILHPITLCGCIFQSKTISTLNYQCLFFTCRLFTNTTYRQNTLTAIQPTEYVYQSMIHKWICVLDQPWLSIKPLLFFNNFKDIISIILIAWFIMIFLKYMGIGNKHKRFSCAQCLRLVLTTTRLHLNPKQLWLCFCY